MVGATTPRELTGAEIEEIIDRFAAVAAVCATAGFDGVQIHGAHGYLVSQFLSPLSNRRTDEWGGDPERRRRFALEIVRRIRSRVSPGFAVAIKLNSADFQRGGFSEDDSRDVLSALAGEGLDLIEISGGSYESPAMMGTAAASTRARESPGRPTSSSTPAPSGRSSATSRWPSPEGSGPGRPWSPPWTQANATSSGSAASSGSRP